MDVGDIPQVHGDPVDHVHHEAPQAVDAGDELAGIHEDAAVDAVEGARARTHVGDTEGPRHIERRRLPRPQGLGAELYPHRARAAADHQRAVGLRHRLELDLDLLGDAAQREIVDFVRS